MSFWELLALVGTMATILGVFLTIYGMINNRTLKTEAKGIREILDRIERGQENLQRETTEVRRETAEARREMAGAIKYLADLIVREGERTREAIHS